MRTPDCCFRMEERERWFSNAMMLTCIIKRRLRKGRYRMCIVLTFSCVWTKAMLMHHVWMRNIWKRRKNIRVFKNIWILRVDGAVRRLPQCFFLLLNALTILISHTRMKNTSELNNKTAYRTHNNTVSWFILSERTHNKSHNTR